MCWPGQTQNEDLKRKASFFGLVLVWLDVACPCRVVRICMCVAPSFSHCMVGCLGPFILVKQGVCVQTCACAPLCRRRAVCLHNRVTRGPMVLPTIGGSCVHLPRVLVVAWCYRTISIAKPGLASRHLLYIWLFVEVDR
eukprot:11915750-Alexandrium_andersonii.AAC.1